MKAFNYIILLAILLGSCTDVIEVDVPEATPRLVIEASLDWEKGTTGNEQEIKLSMSTPYFNQTASPVTGADVRVTNDTTGEVFVFTDQLDGRYTTSSFVPVLQQSYTLQVLHNNQVYAANETLMSVADINEVSQSVENGFDTELIEVNVKFTDPVDEENYYLFKFQEQGDLLPMLMDVNDEFTNGNEMNVFYEKDGDEDGEELNAGDVVAISMFGISSRYHDYIQLLIEQSEQGGDPFSSTPAPLRGNCINVTTPDRYAFGYFRLTQVVRTSYTVQ